jgi:hypothetical protein
MSNDTSDIDARTSTAVVGCLLKTLEALTLIQRSGVVVESQQYAAVTADLQERIDQLIGLMQEHWRVSDR